MVENHIHKRELQREKERKKDEQIKEEGQELRKLKKG